MNIGKNAQICAPFHIKLILCTVMLLLGMSITLLNAMIENLTLSCGDSAGSIGYYLSFYAVGLVCSTLVSGTFSDMAGKRRVISFSLGILALGHIITGLAHSRMTGLAGVFISGLGFSTTEAISSAALTDIDPDNATKWVNISQIFFCAGAVITPVISVWLNTSIGVPHPALFIGLACLDSIVLFLCTFSDFGYPQDKKLRRTIFVNPLRLLKNSIVAIACAEAFLYICYEAIETSYLRFYFQSLGYGETLSATASSVFWATMVAGRLIGARLSGKERKSIFVFSCIFIAGTAILLVGDNLFTHMLGAGIIGLGCGPVWTMIFVTGSREVPQYSGASFSLMMLSTNFGSMLAPICFVTIVGNLRTSMLLCGFFALIIIILNHLSSKKLQKKL